MPFLEDRERNLRAVPGESLLVGEDFRFLRGENCTRCSLPLLFLSLPRQLLGLLKASV